MSNEGVRPLEYKLESIKKFGQPTSQKMLLRFLGMLNFYRKALPNLTDPVTQKIRTPADVLQKLYTGATTKINKNKFEDY